MSGFWQNPSDEPVENTTNFVYNADTVLNTEDLTFHQTSYDEPKDSYTYSQYSSSQQFTSGYSAGFYDPSAKILEQQSYGGSTDFDDEPPLLEELGIEPDQIMKKILVVLDPFTSTVPLGDYDLAGPVIFCLALAGFLLLSDGAAHFGYVYGLTVISCLMMYVLLNLMSTKASFSLTCVASVLGYALLPVVVLSGIGVIFTLRTVLGVILALVAVAWSSIAASRIFVTMSEDRGQLPLLAYPCALLYGVFTLLVIF